MMEMSPLQMLLWIVGLELLSLPLIVGGVRAIIEGYFQSKEKHWSRVLTAAGNTIKKIGEDIQTDEQNKEETKNEG